MARVRMYKAALQATSRAEALRLVDRLMDDVTLASKVIADSGPYATNLPGHLADSIEKDGPRIIGNIITGSVGSDLHYADIAHDGSPVHNIFPKKAPGVWRFKSRKAPQLKFYWRKLGRVVYFPHIPASVNTLGRSHPGYKGKKYLSEPLQVFGRAQGFRVTTVRL
jgi:hypothetical protein